MNELNVYGNVARCAVSYIICYACNIEINLIYTKLNENASKK